MNRLVQILNFLGVLVLVWLCTFQWKDNGRLHAAGEDLERARQEQATKIAEQEKALQGYQADMDDLRAKLSKSDANSKQTQGKLATETTERNQVAAARDQLTAERDQLKAAIGKWSAAVTQRDDAIKEAAERIQKSQAERNEAVTRFNDLVTKYNAAVKDLESRKG